MKRLRFLGMLAVSCLLVSSAVVACGDDEIPTGDADAGKEAGKDTSTADTKPSPPDVITEPVDSGGDTNVEPVESGADADAGEVPDADAGVADADAEPPDLDKPFREFVTEVANRICNSYTRCCFNNANVADGGAVDGGHFDRGACINGYLQIGLEGSSSGTGGTFKAIAINDAKKTDCFAKIDALSCTMGGTELKALRAACFDAIEGQRPVDAPCANSIQCARGSWCNRNGDAGAPDAGGIEAGVNETGKCVPLRANGGPCGDVQVTASINGDSVEAEQACSWRGGGDTGLVCQSYDPVSGNYKADRSTWTCVPALATGAICNTNVSCGAGLCDPGPGGAKYTCEPTLAYFPYGACGIYVKP